MPPPSSVDLDVDLAAFVVGAQAQAALRRLAARHALLGPLDAVVDRVADDVGQRVLDGLDDGLVQLGVRAFHFETHLLAAGWARSRTRRGQFVPDVADRLHARLHDALLQFGGDQVQPLRGGQQGGVVGWVVNWRTWLRASTSSPTRFISLSSSPTSTRMVLSETAELCASDGSAAAGAGSGAGGGGGERGPQPRVGR